MTMTMNLTKPRTNWCRRSLFLAGLLAAACARTPAPAAPVEEAPQESFASSSEALMSPVSDDLLTIQCQWGDGECPWLDETVTPPIAFKDGQWLSVAGGKSRNASLASTLVMQGTGFVKLVQLRMKVTGAPRGRLTVEVRAPVKVGGDPTTGRVLARGRLLLRDVIPSTNVGEKVVDVRVTLDTVAPVTRLSDNRTYYLLVSLKPDDVTAGAAVSFATIDTSNVLQANIANNFVTSACDLVSISPTQAAKTCSWKDHKLVTGSKTLAVLPQFEKLAHASCFDGKKNGREAGRDCGTACGKACARRSSCVVDNDCDPRNVKPERRTACRKPTDLTDSNCAAGGCFCMTKLINGQLCKAGADCASGACLAATSATGVTQPPRCAPATCAPVESPAPTCSVDANCATGKCSGGVCVSVKNGDETDVDCGGSCSVKCAASKACKLNRDCASGLVCAEGVCVADNVGAACLRNSQCSTGRCAGKAGCQPKLGVAQACVSKHDCLSAVCTAGRCTAPGKDKVLNGLESDIDCGGASGVVPRCAAGKKCKASTDCVEGLECGSNGRCGKAAGAVCTAGTQCLSGNCYGAGTTKACVAIYANDDLGHCGDKVMDNDETDVDCGGALCAPCATAKKCGDNDDCESHVCTVKGLCAAATCADGVRNSPINPKTKAKSAEAAADCGGPCALCEAGTTVLEDAPANDDARKSCASGVVSDKYCLDSDCSGYEIVCLDPTCWDGVKNGAETAKDCGGTCQPCASSCTTDSQCASGSCVGGACSTLPTCLVAADCASGVCKLPSPTDTVKRCALPTNADAVKNGTETAVDCGGASGNARCKAGKTCLATSDCDSTSPLSAACSNGICAPATCIDGQLTTVSPGKETDTDCGGVCGKCPVVDGGVAAEQKKCITAADCQSGACSPGFTEGVKAINRCAVPTTTDAFKNGTETDKNCGGTSGKACGYGDRCAADTDCGNQYVCMEGRCRFGVCGNTTKAFRSLVPTSPPSVDTCGRACTVSDNPAHSGLCELHNYCWGDFDCGGFMYGCVKHSCERLECIIGGTHYIRGEPKPGNGCLVCDPLKDPLAWTALSVDDPCSDGSNSTHTDRCVASTAAAAAGQGVLCVGQPYACEAEFNPADPAWACVESYAGLPDTDPGTCLEDSDCEGGKICGRLGRCEGDGCVKTRAAFGDACRGYGAAGGGPCGGGKCTGSDDACPGSEPMASTVICRQATDPCDTVEYCPGPDAAGDTSQCPADSAIPENGACVFVDEDGNPTGATGLCITVEGQRSCVTNVCGNGKVEGPEQCDDGNTVGADGCSADCLVSSLTCSDVASNGGCWTGTGSLKATCTPAEGGGRTCSCPAGYSGSGVGANGCANVDECQDSNACPSGVCVDTVGSFYCIDPCTSNNGGCDATASCKADKEGNVTCDCNTATQDKTGTGLAVTCADKNECLTNNGGCPTGSTCTNTAGGKVCACADGYATSTGCVSSDSSKNPTSPCAATATGPACPNGQTCMVKVESSGTAAKVCVQDPVGRIEVTPPGGEPPPPGSGAAVIFRDIVNLSTSGGGQFQILDRNGAGLADETVVVRTLEAASGAVSGGNGWAELLPLRVPVGTGDKTGRYWDGTGDRVLATVAADRGAMVPVVLTDYFPSVDGTTGAQTVPGLSLTPLRGDNELSYKALPGLPGCNPRALSAVRGAPFMPEAEVLGCSNALFLMGADTPISGRATCDLDSDGETEGPGDQIETSVTKRVNGVTTVTYTCHICTEQVGEDGVREGVDKTFAKRCADLVEADRRSISRLVQTPGVLVTGSGVDADEDSVAAEFVPGTPGATQQNGMLNVFATDTTGKLVRYSGQYTFNVPAASSGDTRPDVERAHFSVPASFTSATVDTTTATWKAFGLAPDGWVYGIGKALNTRVSGATAQAYTLPDGYVVADGDWVRFAGTTMAIAPNMGVGRPRSYLRLYSCIAGACCPLGYKQDANKKCTLDIDECAESGTGQSALVCSGLPRGQDQQSECVRESDGRFTCGGSAAAPACLNTIGGYQCGGALVGGRDEGTTDSPPAAGKFRGILNVLPVLPSSIPSSYASLLTANNVQPFWVLDSAMEESRTRVYERFLYPKGYAFSGTNYGAGTSPAAASGIDGAWLDVRARGYLPAGYVKATPNEPPAYLLNWAATNSTTRVAWTKWTSRAKDYKARTADTFYTQVGVADRKEASGATAGSADIGVTITGPVFSADPTQPPGGGDYWHTPSPGPYSSPAAQAPTWSHVVSIDKAGERTITLSKPVKELYLGVLSLNQGARPAGAAATWVGNTYKFDRDFTIVSQATIDNRGYFDALDPAPVTKTQEGTSWVLKTAAPANDGTTGPEFHGVLKFSSATAFTTLKWVATADETWNGITVGVVVDPAKDTAANSLPADTLAQEFKSTWWRSSRLGPWSGITDPAAFSFATPAALPVSCLNIRGVIDRYIGCDDKLYDVQTASPLAVSSNGTAETVYLRPEVDSLGVAIVGGSKVLVVPDSDGRLLALTVSASNLASVTKAVLDTQNPKAWQAFGVTQAISGASWVVGIGKAVPVGSTTVIDYALPDGYIIKDGDWVRFSGSVMAVVEDPGLDPDGRPLPRSSVRLYSFTATTSNITFTKWSP